MESSHGGTVMTGEGVPFLLHVVRCREEFAAGEHMMVLSFKNPSLSGKDGLDRVSVKIERLPLDDHVSPGENPWLDGAVAVGER